MEALFNDAEATIIISELMLVEFQSAILKKLRTGEISDGAKETAIKNFDKDCTERFILTLLDSRIVKKARGLLKKHGDTHSIRTLDALQLAACLSEKTDEIRFICADNHLLTISELEKVQVINPATC